MRLDRTKMLVPLTSVLLLISASVPVFGQCTGHAALNDTERNGFVSAAYSGKPDVTVHVLAQPGCSSLVRQALQQLGATERFADDKVGYAIVLLPNGKVLDVIDLPGIAYTIAKATDRYSSATDWAYVPPAERTVAPVPPITLPTPRVATTLPVGGPYYAAAEAGLTALWATHPEADGRGVRIAVIDEGFDLLHPELEVARDAKGNEVPKVADVMPVTTPDESSNWVQFGDPIRTTKGTFTAAGRTWTAPNDGTFRFGIFTKKAFYLAGEFWAGEKEHDPRVKNVPLSVGVLWNEDSNRVWVDTDGDGSFRNERALGDYGETHDVDWFGTKVGDDDNRIPFGVEIDRARHAAYLSIAVGGHGGVIAGPLAGNRLTGGLFDGAAPSAQLVDIPNRPYLQAFVSSFAHPDVDVVNLSGILPDGTFYRHLGERVIAVYDKPLACLCVLANALNVGDYASPEMLRRNRQLLPPHVDHVRDWVFFTDDGFQNLIYAPSTSLVTESRYLPWQVRDADGWVHDDSGHKLAFAPPGYRIGDNSSPTIPVVTGVLADLISEARREHIRYSVARLNQAVLIGARQLPGIPTSRMGFGVVDAADAWAQLAKMAKGDDPANPELTSFAVTRRDGSDDIAVNGFPVHGFHAELPQAGSTLSDELWITRHGGYASGRPYRLSLRGNDGTYQLRDQTATFVRDKPVRVRFTATVEGGGTHAAFLALEDMTVGAVMQEIPFTVRVPDVPERTAPWVETYRANIPPRSLALEYVHIDRTTQAARYVMRIPFVGMHDLMAGLPDHMRINNIAASGPPIDLAHHVGPMQNIEQLAAIPDEAKTQESMRSMSFVWRPLPGEVWWSSRGGSEYEGPSDPPGPDVPITATLRVEQYAVAFDRQGGSANPPLQVTNKQASIAGRPEFYSAELATSEVTASGSHAFATVTRTLPGNLYQWRVAVSSPTETPDTVDAFLLDCTGAIGCTVAEHAPLVGRRATLVRNNPKEGKWQVLIRARQPGAIARIYRISDAELIQGTSPAEANDATYATGAIWTVPVPSAAKQGDAQYVAFRIAGPRFRILDDTGHEPSVYHEKEKRYLYHTHADALRIALTPLTPGAP